MPTYKPRALVLDDDADVLKVIVANLRRKFDISEARTLEEARQELYKRDGKHFSVVVVDMRLKEGPEGGFTLIEELSTDPLHPEMVIFTAYPSYGNINKYMQAGVFGYVVKGEERTLRDLEDTCLKASAHWYRRLHRIPDAQLADPVAILCGDIIQATEQWDGLENAVILPLQRIWRVTTYRTIEGHKGTVVQCSEDSFLSIFTTVQDAMEAAQAIQHDLYQDTHNSPGGPVQMREVLHWGEVEKVVLSTHDNISGPAVSLCIRAIEHAHPILDTSSWHRQLVTDLEKRRHSPFMIPRFINCEASRLLSNLQRSHAHHWQCKDTSP